MNAKPNPAARTLGKRSAAKKRRELGEEAYLRRMRELAVRGGRAKAARQKA